MLEQVLSADRWLIEFINIGMANPFFDALMVFITELGLFYLWIPVALFLLLSRKKLGISLSAGMVVIGGLILILKELFQRVRPQDTIEGIRVLVTETDPAFPSGHTATAFLVAVILSKYYPRQSWVFYALAGIVAVSRIYVGVHFPIDVLVGAALGLIVGFGVRKLTIPKKYRFK